MSDYEVYHLRLADGSLWLVRRWIARGGQEPHPRERGDNHWFPAKGPLIEGWDQTTSWVRMRDVSVITGPIEEKT